MTSFRLTGSRSVSIRGILDVPRGEMCVRLESHARHATMRGHAAAMSAGPSTTEPPER
jgi:hypothetical protein